MLVSKYICTILLVITSTAMTIPIPKGVKSDKIINSDKPLNNKIKSDKKIKSESF
jgi:hypothetical protein